MTSQRVLKLKKILSFTLKFLVSGSLLLYLFYFSGIVDVQEVIKTLSHTRVSIYIPAFFVYLGAAFVSTKRWSLFIPARLKYSRLVSLFFIGSFFNTFLPGLVGGDAVKAYYLYKDMGKGRGGGSLASVFMDRYLGFIAMSTIALIALIAGYPYVKGTEITWFVPVLCAVVVVASLVLWGLNWGRIKFLKDFYTPLMGFKGEKKNICKGLLLGAAVQILGITCIYILSLAIGLKVPVIYFFIFVPIINALAAIPVSIAGLGIRETGFAALFKMVFDQVGVTSGQAVSLSILLFLTIFLISLIGGIEYLRLGKPPVQETQTKTG
ncbi:MAG TPA: flippase-like domain-containing protein [Nitrospirae bacterium]|nr:hypothetical protein BMS3Bbin08_02111 [bacterium BMS3Bbin08]HDH50298.1 flippase-like domain-containing protein [Nitrospirota bacterium]HDK17287.1 flippase-like domain-containing protein [Nitrospirota bacterium]